MLLVGQSTSEVDQQVSRAPSHASGWTWALCEPLPTLVVQRRFLLTEVREHQKMIVVHHRAFPWGIEAWG